MKIDLMLSQKQDGFTEYKNSVTNGKTAKNIKKDKQKPLPQANAENSPRHSSPAVSKTGGYEQENKDIGKKNQQYCWKKHIIGIWPLFQWDSQDKAHGRA